MSDDIHPPPLHCLDCGHEWQIWHGETCPKCNPSAQIDNINHPAHYTSSDASCLNCGRRIECIDVIEHLPANLANAVKYVWRCDLKHDDPTEDLRKAIWYLEREITRRERMNARSE